MRKILVYSIVGIVVVIGAVGILYKKNITGALPAILPPTGDIAEVIENSEKSDTPLVVPPGFSISIYAKDLGDPRVLSFMADGNLAVSVPSQGKIIALEDKDKNGLAETHTTIAEGLNHPHGFLNWCEGDVCRFYIAESDQVAEFDYDKPSKKVIHKRKLFSLPGGGNHKTRTIMFEPFPNDSKMLVSIGSSCNVCVEKDELRGKVFEYDLITGKLSEFAKGLRNSVFMAIHPVTGDIWATEMGRDMLGDDIPPDEVNILKKGGNYGWPICYGKNIHDDNFDKNTYIRNPCMEPFETPSFIDLQAHSAPLGLAFFPEEGWPEEYWHNMLVAYHGSWNRTVPTGYKIVRFKLDTTGKYISQEDFITGFISAGKVYGRPVDIIISPGGTMYISDDKAGVIYKVRKN